MLQVSVRIAGGGPVGLTLALELARYGIRSIVTERNPSTTTHSKMDLTNGRSMELRRRLGLADCLRAVGIPADHSFDISWITNLNGAELPCFPYPSSAKGTRLWRKRNDGMLTLEAPVLDDSASGALEIAALQHDVPSTVLRLRDPNAARIYERKLMLVRPDQRVAWRGEQLPADSGTVLACAVGQAGDQVADSAKYPR
jgi:2-polyprenyl-6-methoxyphenol hydroxylase-like FAD-dependent oxidoreductase